jgi:hypothetical protein
MSSIPVESDFFPASELSRLDKRIWILSYARQQSVGAEFGVFRGHFSKRIAETLNPKKLYLVDPWTRVGEKFDWGNSDPYTNFNRLTTQQAKDDCIHRVKRFIESGMVEVIEMTDYEFIDILLERGEKLDFVYLDTSHSYNSTISELRKIDLILNEDGVIMGDDWVPNRNHVNHGVFRAIHDFIRSNEYEILAAGPAGQFCLRRRRE